MKLVGIIGVSLISFSVALSGCQSWPQKRFEEVTGIQVGEKLSICKNITTHGSLDCKPATGGRDWNKVTNVTPITFPNEGSPKKQANIIFQSYIGHPYQGLEVQPGCPKINPFDDENIERYRKYIGLQKAIISITSIYSLRAVTEARVKLEAAASKSGLALNASALANFESSLKDTIEASTKESANVIYVQAYWKGGVKAMSDFEPYKNCIDKIDVSRESIITGIAGFYLSDFKTAGNYFQETWMRSAIDASIKAESKSQLKVLQDVSASASASWSKEINESLSLEMKGKEFSQNFVPLYIRFEWIFN